MPAITTGRPMSVPQPSVRVPKARPVAPTSTLPRIKPAAAPTREYGKAKPAAPPMGMPGPNPFA